MDSRAVPKYLTDGQRGLLDQIHAQNTKAIWSRSSGISLRVYRCGPVSGSGDKARTGRTASYEGNPNYTLGYGIYDLVIVLVYDLEVLADLIQRGVLSKRPYPYTASISERISGQARFSARKCG